MVNLSVRNPDRGDYMDFTMVSFDTAKANIEAMLAVTFARSMKMMKFINKIYDADKDCYAVSPRKLAVQKPPLYGQPHNHKEIKKCSFL